MYLVVWLTHSALGADAAGGAALGGALTVPDFVPVNTSAADEVEPARTGGPGFLPAVMHMTTAPLMPQAYRSVPAGKYQCSVTIQLGADGAVTGVLPVACDKEALWALSAAIQTWRFESALQDGQPVASTLAYTTEFDVRTLRPREHVVGLVGLVGSAGGESVASLDGRIHLGETFSVSFGVGVDANDRKYFRDGRSADATFHGDLALSSPRQYFEHRGIFGGALGLYDDTGGQTGLYGTFRGELMTAAPGLSVGADIGVATVWWVPGSDTSLGMIPRIGALTVYPWLRASLIWYAPVPRDQFAVVPRADDPVLYQEAASPDPEPPSEKGYPFEGVPAVPWSKLPVSGGSNPVPGQAFADYPPGQYPCTVRVVVGADGEPKRVRAEKCPSVGVGAAEAAVETWKWQRREGTGDLQAVFPAPIYVEREDGDTVSVLGVATRSEDGTLVPVHASRVPDVYVHTLYTPVFTNGVTPSQPCRVDVDLDRMGAVLAMRWRSGDIEVKGRVFEALRLWQFYGVPVEGELVPVRVSLDLCSYMPHTTQEELDAAWSNHKVPRGGR